MHQNRPFPGNGGYVLITVLLALAVVSALGAAALDLAYSSLKQAQMAAQSEQAFYAANAGMEDALARALGGAELAPGTALQQPVIVAPGVTAEYAVRLEATATDGILQVTSEGVAGNSRRSITARLRWKPESSTTYEHLVFSTGSITMDNHTDVCGDLYAGGDVTLSAQTTLWGKTTAEDPDSPCREVVGTGKVLAAGRVTFIGKAKAQGNWCDSLNYGPGFACSSPPAKPSMAPPDFADLKSRATRWYVSDAALCAGKPAGACTVVPAGFTLTLSGTQHFTTDLLYVEGNVEIAPSGWTPSGLVTVTATGVIDYLGNVQTDPAACASPGSCASAFISQGAQTVGRNIAVSGTFITANTTVGFTWGNSSEIRGVVLAPRVASGNHGTFYPIRLTDVWLPPGVTAPGSSAIGYSEWQQQ